MKNAVRKQQRYADRLMGLEEAMFDWRSRHLILVLTLRYKPEWRQAVTLDTLRQHRNQLLNNVRCNTLLNDINAYAWKIEEGQKGGGLHLHVVIFYDGQHCEDIRIARAIGEYWNAVITQGMGEYWNSNAEKSNHARYGHGIGTGQIDRHDEVKREALRKNLLYLTKEDQHVTLRMNQHTRMFGTSQLPSKQR